MRSALLFALFLASLASSALAQGPALLDLDRGEAVSCDPRGAASLGRGALREAQESFEETLLHVERDDPCRAAICLYFVGRIRHLRGDLTAAERAYRQYTHYHDSANNHRGPTHDLEHRLRLRTDGHLRALREQAGRPRRRWLWGALGAASSVLLLGAALSIALPLQEHHIYYP